MALDPRVILPNYRLPAGDPASTPSTDGKVLGVDGMLDQITGSVVRQVRAELWPAIQADHATQQRVGHAIGQGVGRELRPYAIVTAGGVVVGTIALLAHVANHWGER